MKFYYLEHAIQIAAIHHTGQLDKSDVPYILHPLRVMLQFEDYDLQTVAVLHDVIEDTTYTEEQLRQDFPRHIADAVIAISKIPGENYREYFDRVVANPLAKQVKLKDWEDNCSPIRLAKLHIKEQEYLKNKYFEYSKYLKEEEV